MALDKNKAGIMAAIQAATEGKAPIGNRTAPTTPEAKANDRAHRALPRGTIGSVRAGLGGIQSVDTALILPWGPTDRFELTAVNSDEEDGASLLDSIREHGQQVPVLLRPAPDRDGKFEVIYGRRRILACKQLGIPVNALIRTMDDTAALMAKGLENASRESLSFHERARFAADILAQGHSRDTAMAALAISKNTLSQLERIARLIPQGAGDLIGAAPNAGRPKWMALAAAFESGELTEEFVSLAVSEVPIDATSDDRMAAVLNLLGKRGTTEARAREWSPQEGVAVKATKSSVSLTLRRSGNDTDFASWFEANADRLIKESYLAFKEEAGR